VGLAALPLAITIVVTPAQLKMETTAPTATVTVTAPGARELRLWCSVGEVSRPTTLPEGRFTATYQPPPPGGKPTYAVLAAWDERTGEAATATLTLAARVEIPVETEPGALVVGVVHGKRSTARANGLGHARLMAWVWPGDHTATVTALDAAGNATTNEVLIDVPRPDGVFLLAPPQVAPDTSVRVYAFATSGAKPQLQASDGGLAELVARPGATSAVLRTRVDVTLTATAAEDRVQQPVRVATATPPTRSIALTNPPPPAPSTPPPPVAPPPVVESPPAVVVEKPLPPLSPWELGAAASGRYAGAFVGAGATVEARRRLRRFAVGLDLDGHWATGAIDADAASLGGLSLSAVGEVRLPVTMRVSLFLAVALGAHYARVVRTPSSGAGTALNDGGPSLGARIGVDARVGPGYIVIGAGYAWTPLYRGSLVNIDGGVLSVGYRAARWHRRGGGRRRAHRRRRAPRS
jgi:hypothetical protein